MNGSFKLARLYRSVTRRFRTTRVGRLLMIDLLGNLVNRGGFLPHFSTALTSISFILRETKTAYRDVQATGRFSELSSDIWQRRISLDRSTKKCWRNIDAAREQASGKQKRLRKEESQACQTHLSGRRSVVLTVNIFQPEKK